MKILQGTPDEIGLALSPIKVVSGQIAKWMKTTGTGTKCGGCGKPFNVARKRRGIVRITHLGDAGLMLNTWVLCGSCNHKAKRNGGRVPVTLKREARQGYEDLRLMMASSEAAV